MKNELTEKLTRDQKDYQKYAYIPRRICESYSEEKITTRRIIDELLNTIIGPKYEEILNSYSETQNGKVIIELTKYVSENKPFPSDNFNRYFEAITHILSCYLCVPICEEEDNVISDNTNGNIAEKNDIDESNESGYDSRDCPDNDKEDGNGLKKYSRNIKALMNCMSNICEKALPGHNGIIQLLSPYNVDNYYKDRKFEFDPIVFCFDDELPRESLVANATVSDNDDGNECIVDIERTVESKSEVTEILAKKHPDYYGIFIINEFLFTFICNIFIHCLHNKPLSAKQIAEIYVTVLLSFYHPTYLIIRERCKGEKIEDPLLYINDNACYTDEIADLLMQIQNAISGYPYNIYETKDITDDMKKLVESLVVLNDSLIEYTDVLPRIPIRAISHKSIKSYDEIVQLFTTNNNNSC